MLPRALLPIALTLACGVFSARAQEIVRIATAPAIGSGATLIAIERGYFRDVGIKVEIDNIDSSANGLALLAQNRYQIVEGGISAGYFNAIAKGLPITMVMSRATTPVGHALMLRIGPERPRPHHHGPQGPRDRDQWPGLGVEL